MTRRDPLTLALRAALAVCAGCGWLAASMVILDHLDPPGSWPRATACLAWLVFAPLYEDELAAGLERIPIVGLRAARWVWVLEVLPVFFLPTPMADALIFGSMVLAQGHLFLAGDDDRGAARCLTAAPLVVVLGLAYAPSLALLALLPVTAVAAITAMVLLSGRASRRRVRRGMPAAETGAGVRGRLGYAPLLALAGLVLSMLLFVALTSAIEQDEADAQPAVTPLGPGEKLGLLPSGDGADGGNSEQGFAPELAFAGNSTLPFSDEVVLYLSPLEGAKAHGTVHLRDMVLDTFTGTTVRLGDRSLPPTHHDASDGERDGWTWVTSPHEDLETRTYRVDSRRLSLSAQAGWTLVFGPHPLAAVELASVDYHPDQVLFTHEPVPAWFRYRVKVIERDTSPEAMRGRSRSRRVAGRYLKLPPSSPAMEEISALAREWTRGASSDYEKVQAIVRHLRTEFDYELRELDFKGPEAMRQFLRERRGYCTYFATAAALMLRTRGVPTRVATGFLAHEWEEGQGRWIVRERDAHAWIEVAFEETGWVTFDPTPAGAQDRAARAGLPDELAEGDLPWRERLAAALEQWLDADGSLGSLLSAMVSAPAEELEQTPALWLLPSGLVLLLLHLLLRGRARPRSDEIPGDLPPRTFSLFQRLAQVLGQHGHRRAPGQTPREFARGLPAGDVAFSAVDEATDLYYRARYGAIPLVAEEERFVERLVQDLTQRLPALEESVGPVAAEA